MNAKPTSIFLKQAEICLNLAARIEQKVIANGCSADQQLAEFYRHHREYGSRDRRFFSSAIFSYFRWRGWLKASNAQNLAAAILLDAASLPPQITPLAMIAGLNTGELKPMGHLNLEDKAAALHCLIKEKRPDIKQLIPDWFAEMIYQPSPKDASEHLARCIKSFQSRPPTWLRLRSDRAHEAKKYLADMRIETDHHPFMQQALSIKGNMNRDLTRLRGAELQDLASQCVGLCCAPRPGESWWDVCAGAGGKTLHLADLMNDQGFILATDIRPAILNQLAKRLEKNKYRSVRMELINKTKAQYSPGTFFDGVIIDAPCSGSGTWHRNPDARWRSSPAQVKHYAEIQAGLLEMAAGRIKTGGRLVYATCSLTALENIVTINSFLAKHYSFKLEPIPNPMTRQQTGGMIWIWPWEWNCNGMFIAVMKKSA